MTFLARVLENSRAEEANDHKFRELHTYFFELQVPEEIATAQGDRYLFPLALNPESITLEEPFAVQRTPTQGGGLYVEENGIIFRIMRIRGHTGFAPRKPRQGRISDFTALQTPERRSYSRLITNSAPIDIALSGQRRFQYLQDVVFRTYADLKRDKTTAFSTKLYFHNPKDDEHWRVVPLRFTLERDKSNRVLYRYNIELLVVDKAEEKVLSEDLTLLESIRAAIQTVATAVDTIRGAVQAITQVIGEVKQFVAGVFAIIDSARALIDDVTNVITGVTDLITTPIRSVEALIEDLETSLVAVANAVDNTDDAIAAAVAGVDRAAAEFPDTVRQAFRDIEFGAETILQFPELFEAPAQVEITALQTRNELSLQRSTEVLEGAATFNTFLEAAALGSGPVVGEAERAAGERGIGRGQPVFPSAKEHVVEQTDTLQSLASRFLGDARLWKHIAVVNKLRSPYISESGAEGTIAVGGTLLVPSFARAPRKRPQHWIIGTSSELPAPERSLGRDLQLKPHPRDSRRYDLAIDVNKGNTDARTVGGIPNLQQALELRLRVERGTAVLYRDLGYRRVTGTLQLGASLDALAFRLSESVGNDPRVASVRDLRFVEIEGVALDAVVVEMSAEIRDFRDSQKIRARIP